MSERIPIVASRWPSPFEYADPDRVHLLRVTYPSCAWVHYASGTHFDFSQFTDEGYCEILIFSEDDRTVYRISAEVSAIQIHDERDLPQIEEWSDGTGRCCWRLVGTPMQKSLSGFLNGEQPSYCIITGGDCVEFICLNEPRVKAIGTVEDGRPALN
jgi:hypothetical protein